MKAYALIVGNSAYHEAALDNAVNDATAMANKLLKLGYVVDLVVDATIEKMSDAITGLSKKLKNVDIALFYFSGHGLQIDGHNYLTAIDANFADETSIKYHGGFNVSEVIERFEKANVQTKILVLDACRNNPLKHRGLNEGLAPIYAPKGTIIAFSTSPGETASDAGMGGHSVYTGTLLSYIDEENITIEECFKRVRTTVYAMTKGKQLSWEHTSLIGDFYFNEGKVNYSDDVPYRDDVVCDGKWISSGTKAEAEIEKLKESNWYKQNPALQKLDRMSIHDMDKNVQFLFGRNLLQVADGDEFLANKIFEKLGTWLEDWMDGEENHVLNGILFEVFFNSEGKFRKEHFKSSKITEICKLEGNRLYGKSFGFIEKLLLPFKQFVFYIPSPHPKSLSIEALFESKSYDDDLEGKRTIYKLTSLQIKGQEILAIDMENTWYPSATMGVYELKQKLSYELCVPMNRIHLTSNVSIDELDGNIRIPHDGIKVKK